MDEKSLEILEFPQIKQLLAGFTSFSASRQLALDLQPAGDFQEVSHRLQQSAEARHLLDLDPDFSIGGVHDIRQAVKMASVGKVLDPQDLVIVQETLAAISQVRGHLKSLSDEVPLLWEIASQLVEFYPLVRRITGSLASDGQVLDSASPQLASIRRQLNELRLHLHDKLDSIMKSSRGRKLIQEPVIVEREGRYVIPVKIEHQKEIRGIVHDVSNTGATVFIEPWVTMDMGNSLREKVMQEKREVERILQNLSMEVGIHEAEIAQDISLMAELDLALAKARYARKLRAVEPTLVDFNEKQETGGPARVMKLVEARHPLLGDNAIPLTVEIGRDFSILVITGPNTGGKTVALKTFGLLSLMALSGIPVPASAESQLPIFDNIFADIGDEQSIAQTLSTFSWHVGNIVRIVNQATDRSLVLLDELGTSTDPIEGSALAVSVLRHFLSRRIMAVATTHFSEVKAFAHNTPGMQNASFDIDPVKLTPTYHLTMGIPSGSNALAVARRLGLSGEIVAEAERLVPEGIREMERLLTSLKTKEVEIATLHQQAEKERDEVAKQNQELQKERQQAKAEMNNMVRESRDRVVVEAAELSRQIRQAESELRKEKSRERLKQAKETITAVRQQLDTGPLQPATGDTVAPQPEESRIIVGDVVTIRDVGLKATVLSIAEDRHEAEVQAGQTRLKLGLDRIEKATPLESKIVTMATPIKLRRAERPVSRELDLRGKRAEEIQPILEQYLNDASVTNQSEVRIIHGFGTGTVRQIVRESLAAHPLVKSFRAGKQNEGGDGVTIVQL